MSDDSDYIQRTLLDHAERERIRQVFSQQHQLPAPRDSGWWPWVLILVPVVLGAVGSLL